MQSAQEMTDKPHIIADCDIPFLKGLPLCGRSPYCTAAA